MGSAPDIERAFLHNSSTQRRMEIRQKKRAPEGALFIAGQGRAQASPQAFLAAVIMGVMVMPCTTMENITTE